MTEGDTPEVESGTDEDRLYYQLGNIAALKSNPIARSSWPTEALALLCKPFTPYVRYIDDCCYTEIMLEDGVAVWESWGSLELAYNENHDLIGIRIMGNVTSNKKV